MLKRIKKRDGRIASFDQERITEAIFKAAQAVGGSDREIALELSNAVSEELEKRFGRDGVPSVEETQDVVEKVLIEKGHAKTAKAYILYRKQRADTRNIEALMNSFDLVEGYLQETDWRVREN